MGDDQGRKPRDEGSSHKAGVKPRGCGASADSPIARQVSDCPMFDKPGASHACEHLTLSNCMVRTRMPGGVGGVEP